ncbi:hypothetical protein PF003_g35510 [Phytophthora fragariae]|nr:hypothetical protein PF003_g35510 [Phytophthora fragariae]
MERMLRKNGSRKEVLGHPPPKRARIDEGGLIAEAVLAYAASIGDAVDIPTTHAQAMASDDAAQWCEVMDAELLSHERNGTWTLVPRGTANRTMGGRWVLQRQRDQYGSRGALQGTASGQGLQAEVRALPSWKTYSPVANMNSIRVVLSVCAAYEYRMEQLDADHSVPQQ